VRTRRSTQAAPRALIQAEVEPTITITDKQVGVAVAVHVRGWGVACSPISIVGCHVVTSFQLGFPAVPTLRT